MVEAIAHMATKTTVVIAGTGSMAGDLEARATELGCSDRLRLPGFVSDDELIELYAGALGVMYVPLDEDYGYVTLQAFLAGKPVITAEDSGGVLEFVEDGVTGFVTDGSAERIAAAVDQLALDPELARTLGDAGQDRARALDWPSVVARLTS
jgi:glycosyltransferase involved in cell wall biosynthesis